MTITLYDFDSDLPARAMSPFVWRVRFALNIKGIKHQTEWLNYAKLEEQLKGRNIAPTKSLPDGTPFYTVPAIHDPSTGTTLADSHLIIKYLDETYPDTPQLSTHPNASDDLLKPAFAPMWLLPLTALMLNGMWGLVVPTVVAHSDEASALTYKRRFEDRSGMTLESVLDDKKRAELLKIAQANFSEADARLQDIRNKYGGDGPWLLGKEVKLPDLAFAGSLAWIYSIVGEDSDLWKEIRTWDGGRWAKFWDEIAPYYKLY